MSETVINPKALTAEQLAAMLSAVSEEPITEEMIRRHIDTGAPASPDGTINLVDYAAWLNADVHNNGA